MTGWRRLATGLTPALITLWVAFLVLGTLQPCCEVVAAPFVAAGPVSSAGYHRDLMEKVHHSVIDGSAPVHTHCGQTLHRHPQLKALNGSESGKGNPVHPAAAVAVVSPVDDAAICTVFHPSVNDRGRSPPLPVYLATLRLRL